MTWEPQHEGLQQIITILRESQSPDTQTQRAVQMVRFFITFSLFGYYVSPDDRRLQLNIEVQKNKKFHVSCSFTQNLNLILRIN